jgi:hypothetical protein
LQHALCPHLRNRQIAEASLNLLDLNAEWGREQGV